MGETDAPVDHDRVAGCSGDGMIAGGRLTLILLPDDDHRSVELTQDLLCIVCRAVIDNDALKAGVLQTRDSIEAAVDPAAALIGAHNHRSRRPGAIRREREVCEHPTHAHERRLGAPITAREPKAPVGHFAGSGVPLIGPGVHEDPGTSAGKRRADLCRQRSGLRFLAMSDAVKTDLAHDERPVTRDVVQPFEVRRQVCR